MEQVRQAFYEEFGEPELLVHSPGRINFIGGHTDYHEGFVLPAAIESGLGFVLRRNGTPDRARVRAMNVRAESHFDIGAVPATSEKWERYVKGMTVLMRERLPQLEGFDLVFGGDLPIGAGLSSSAALCCGLGLGLNALAGGNLDRLEIARLAQTAEHRYAGVKCGLLDQMAVLFAKPDYALFIDCRSQKFRAIPLALRDHALVLIDSRVRHDHAESGYNQRVAETAQGLAVIRKEYPHVAALRDVDQEMLRAVSEKMPPEVLARCLYVVAENRRVESAVEHLENGQLGEFGELMFETHLGLRDLYRVSCPELDFLAEMSALFSGCVGARMVGGGFGGNLLAIVERSAVDRYIGGITQRFAEHFGKSVAVRTIMMGAGATVERIGGVDV
ncbi:MAG: galactokinase [Bacteroidota bacterium]